MTDEEGRRRDEFVRGEAERASLIANLLGLREQMAPFREYVEGEVRHLVETGFTEQDARRMIAAEYVGMWRIWGQQQQGAGGED